MVVFFRKLCFFLFIALSSCGTSPKPSYIIAVDPAFYSIESMGREKNILAFLTDLVSAVSIRSRMSMHIQPTNWNSLVQGLEEHQYQGIFSGINQYNFTENKYSFSSVLIKTGPVVVVAKNTNFKALADLNNTEVGILSDSDAVHILSPYPDIIIRLYDSIPKLLNDVVQNNIEAAIIPALPAAAYCSDLFQDTLRIANEPMTDSGLKLITLKQENKELIEGFNRAIYEMGKDGTIDKLKAKWSLPY